MVKPTVHRFDIIHKIADIAGTRDGNDIIALVEQPRQRQPGKGDVSGTGDRFQPTDQTHVPVAARFGGSGKQAPEILIILNGFSRQLSGAQSPAKGAVGNKTDAVLAQHRQQSGFYIPGKQGVFGLDAGDRVSGVRLQYGSDGITALKSILQKT
jgi:hypothetical protein